MINIYIAHRLLQDFGLSSVHANGYEGLYLKVKRDSDVILRIANIKPPDSFDSSGLLKYCRRNWLVIRNKPGLSEYGKFVALFSLIQMQIRFYKAKGDKATVSLLAVVLIEYSHEIPDWVPGPKNLISFILLATLISTLIAIVLIR